MQAIESQLMFRGTCSFHHQGQRIRQARKCHEALFATCFKLVFCLVYLSLKMVECSSETSADLQGII
jgi:hypothetical protein